NVKLAKELWDSLESMYMVEDALNKKFLKFVGPSVNMTEEGGKNKHHKQNKGKKRSNENNSGSSSNKKPKLKCWKCGKTGHFKRDFRTDKKNNANAGGSGKGLRTNPKTKVDAIAWSIDSGATTHVCKDRCWFKTYKPVEDGYVLYMGDDRFARQPFQKSRNAIFDENRFSSIPRPKDIIPNLVESQRDDHSDNVPSETPEPRRGKRSRKAKSYGFDF
nr:hypothetical protein [Tanacetum cinerariifolium]